MLPMSLDTLRIFLHVTAATIWVGGQIVLVWLLPTVRQLGDDAPRLAARRFNVLAWSAFVVLVATGIWNLLEVDLGDVGVAYHATLGAKLAVVTLSGIGAGLHAGLKGKAALAIGGALSLLGGLAAVWFGIVLAGS
jgi:putative copper export protein